MRNLLKTQIENYLPVNDQELKDKGLILEYLKQDHIFTRENTTAHFTVSGWVINKQHTKVLMCYHNIYNSWAWLGGHADGNENLLEVALKEVNQECGLTNVKPLHDTFDSLEILTVNGHNKNGQYVSSHLHINITYIFVADENDRLKVCENENSDLRWFTFKEALKASKETWFVENIYPKLISKSLF